MRKMTLLEMVQNIASALETDEINSITDTTESLQIAEVIKETFYEQFNNIFIPEHQGLFALESVSDLDSPNYLRVPDNISKILWLRYNDYRLNGAPSEVEYISPEEFLFTQFQYTSDYNHVLQTTDPSSGVKYYITTNSRPTLFTMFDDKHIAFNSFDADYEDSAQGDNAIGYGSKTTEFLMEDNFIPPIDGNLFPLLLSESKSVCFYNLKQVASSKDEQRARRQRIRMQNDQFKSRKAQYDHWNERNNYSRHRG
jgi:hypothetical protein